MLKVPKTMTFKDFQPQNQSLSRQIADKIQLMVTNGELASGDRLPSERQLAEQLQVSRNVIREAMVLLEERGVVSVQVGSGVYITDTSTHTVGRSVSLYVQRTQVSIAQLFEIRWILEVENARLSAMNATPEEIAALEETITDMEAHMDDLEKFTTADMRFHHLLASATQNPLLPVLLNTISDLLHEQARIASASQESRENALKHHRNIFRAVRSKSGLLAHGAMAQHLTSGWEYLLKAMKNPEEQIGQMRFVKSNLPEE
jgi:GntR family transcriptional regulator, transcriptional repressor for pyruvate dehydrogenase complex